MSTLQWAWQAAHHFIGTATVGVKINTQLYVLVGPWAKVASGPRISNGF
jgi:hypothetical protein